MQHQIDNCCTVFIFHVINLKMFSYITECSNRSRQHDRGETINEFFCKIMNFNNKCILQQSLFSSTRIE